MRRKPTNPDAAITEGVDYLLREFKTLQRPVPATGTAAAGGAGPIEVTYLVASSEARAAIQAVADYVCNGTADEIEINAPFEAAKAAGLACKVQLSAGAFHVADEIVVDAIGSWLGGAGMGVTLIVYDDDAWPATTPVVDVIDPQGGASNFTIMPESDC